VLAVDISNYTDPLTPTAVEGLNGAGVSHVVVQAIDPPPGYPVGRTRQQIQLCQSAGLTVDAYVRLWFDLDIASSASSSTRHAQPRRTWLHWA
jgi:hypothetical protein